MAKTCGIYGIRHRLSGRWYVGMSSNIEFRWRQHIYQLNYGRGCALYAALKKHGIDAFEFKILEVCDKSTLLRKEAEWVEKLDAYENGFNMTRGGEVNCMLGNTHRPEVRKRISEKNKGHVVTEATRKKISESKKGHDVSPELRDKWSAERKGVPWSAARREAQNNRINKPGNRKES